MLHPRSISASETDFCFRQTKTPHLQDGLDCLSLFCFNWQIVSSPFRMFLPLQLGVLAASRPDGLERSTLVKGRKREKKTLLEALQPLANLCVHLCHCIQMYPMRARFNDYQPVVVKVRGKALEKAFSADTVMRPLQDEDGQLELALGAQNLDRDSTAAVQGIGHEHKNCRHGSCWCSD